MDRGFWQTTVHGVAESDMTEPYTCTHARTPRETGSLKTVNPRLYSRTKRILDEGGRAGKMQTKPGI